MLPLLYLTCVADLAPNTAGSDSALIRRILHQHHSSIVFYNIPAVITQPWNWAWTNSPIQYIHYNQ